MLKDVKMTLVEHLDELRSRIIYSLIAVVIIAIFAYFFRNQILALLTRPLGGYLTFSRSEIPLLLDALRNYLEGSASAYFTPEQIAAIVASFQRVLYLQTGLIFIHPTEAFFSYLKLAIFTGILLGAPFIIYQVWRYVLPALFEHERKYTLNAFTFGTVLFYTGAAFAFIVVMPLGVRFLIRIGGPYVQPTFTIGNYISFTMLFMLAFGLIFELPVVIFLLVKAGIVSTAFLKKERKYVIVLAFVAAAILTPPDPFTQLTMAIPLLLLYELSLFLARFAERKPEAVKEGGAT